VKFHKRRRIVLLTGALSVFHEECVMAGEEFAMGSVNVIYDYTVGITRIRTNLMPSNNNL
jgi:hypothetical protein